MSAIKITNVQLPDGRLLTIEGGDAEKTAMLLATRYLGQSPIATNAEEPLAAPSMHSFFSKGKTFVPKEVEQPEPHYAGMAPTGNVAGEEEAMDVPVLNFAK
jgi:hypothetical protein